MTVWVIGGDSGIGAATVANLQHMGESVIVSGKEVDVQVKRNIKLFAEGFRAGLTGVIFSAGTNYLEWLGNMDPGQTREVLDTNLLGFINLMDYLAEKKELGPLRVVAVSSDASERPMRTSIAYCASKAGLNMAVKVAARELGPWGWKINAVSPGMTAPTGMSLYIDERVPEVRNWTKERTEKYERDQEVTPGRILPSDVAHIIADTFYGPPHLNGSIITLNGGR